MLLDLLHRGLRRSVENPAVPLSQAADLWDDDGLDSGAGVRVTKKKLLTHSAVYRGVNLISGDVGKLPLVVYRNQSGGGKEKDRGHGAYRLLRRRPTPAFRITPLIFRQTVTAHAILHGNGYAYVMRSGSGAPIELLPLNPCSTKPVRVNGELWYVTTFDFRGETMERKLPPDDVLHIKGLGYDGLSGYSLIHMMAVSVGHALAAREYGARFFKNSARPSVILEHPGTLKEEGKRNLADTWNKLHAGIDNAHKTAVLEEGLKANVIGMSAKDSQLLDTLKFSIIDAANWLGLPPHKLGHDARSSYNSLEQENRSYLVDALDRWLVAWEQECEQKLLTEAEQLEESHCIEFLRAAMEAADKKTEVEALAVQINNSMLTPDEARRIMNRPAYPNGIGSMPRMPANHELVTEFSKVDPAPPPAEEEGLTDEEKQEQEDEEKKKKEQEAESSARQRQAIAAIVRDTVGRMVRRLGVHTEKLGRSIRDVTGPTLAERLLAENREVLVAALGPVIDLAGVRGGDHGDLAERLCRAVADVGSDFPGKAEGIIAQFAEELLARIEKRSP